MSEETIPVVIAQQAQEMTQTIGLSPAIERVRANRWRLTLSNDRVTATVDYKTYPRFNRVDSTLTIDGESRRSAKDLEHLARFFNDTTAALAELHVPIVVPDDVDASDAPAIVKHLYGILSMIARKHSLDVRITRTENGGWRLGAYTDKELIELNYAQHSGKWTGDHRQLIRLIIDNEDISQDVDSLAEALKHLLGSTGEQPEGRHPMGRTRSVQGKATSVQVRNTAVIRN